MSDQKPLGREAILASKSSKKSKTIDVPELGTIRVMAPDTRGSLFIHAHQASPDALGATFVAVVVDEDGNRVFDLTDDGAAEAMSLPSEVVIAVVNAAVELRQGTIGDEIKNSEASPTSDSPTD